MIDESSGDVVIENGEIQLVNGAELTRQTIKSVLSTKKGEWFTNWDEGVEYDAILGKRYHATQDDEVVRTLMQDGLAQVDENLSIDEFTSEFDNETRKLSVEFTARNSETEESVSIKNIWG